MSLFKRGGTWWIDFTTPSGERIRRSTETSSKAEVQELHDQLKAECWRVQKLGERPKYTWDDAGYKWLMEMKHKRTHHEDMLKIAGLQQFLEGRLQKSAAMKLSRLVSASGPSRAGRLPTGCWL